MNIDRSSFLIIVSTLAVGGAGGYVASEKRVFPGLDKYVGHTPDKPAPEPPPPPPVADAAPAVTAAPPPPPPPAGPTCDDSVATPGACPPPGYPTIEGGCGSFASIRCAEMKQSMKPKVAATAVTCLMKLTPQERCDPARVVLCGHLAYMNACPEADPPAAGGAGALATPGDAGGAKSAVATACQAIIDGCSASPDRVAPSMTECKQLLSGMTEAGRERTRACMKAHCFDRGLVGCEGTNPGK